jgi:hypothetical protein
MPTPQEQAEIFRQFVLDRQAQANPNRLAAVLGSAPTTDAGFQLEAPPEPEESIAPSLGALLGGISAVPVSPQVEEGFGRTLEGLGEVPGQVFEALQGAKDPTAGVAGLAQAPPTQAELEAEAFRAALAERDAPAGPTLEGAPPLEPADLRRAAGPLEGAVGPVEAPTPGVAEAEPQRSGQFTADALAAFQGIGDTLNAQQFGTVQGETFGGRGPSRAVAQQVAAARQAEALQGTDEDPESDASKLAREELKKLGLTVGKNVTAAQAVKMTPFIQKTLSARAGPKGRPLPAVEVRSFNAFDDLEAGMKEIIKDVQGGAGEFLGPARGRLGGIGAKVGAISPREAEFRRKVEQLFSAKLKELSGSQVTASEERRIRATLPSLTEPTANFLTKAQGALVEIAAAKKRALQNFGDAGFDVGALGEAAQEQKSEGSRKFRSPLIPGGVLSGTPEAVAARLAKEFPGKQPQLQEVK